MNKEMTQTKDTANRIDSMMEMFRTESREILLERIHSFLYNMSEDEVIDMHEYFIEAYPEMFELKNDQQ